MLNQTKRGYIYQLIFASSTYTCVGDVSTGDNNKVTVGYGDVERIITTEKNGQMALVEWFVVLDKNNNVLSEHNSAHVESVLFMEPNKKVNKK